MRFEFSPLMGVVFETEEESLWVDITVDGKSLKVPIVALDAYVQMMRARNEMNKFESYMNKKPIEKDDKNHI
jgi:hypothetical protein